MTTVQSMQNRGGYANAPPVSAVVVLRPETMRGLLEAAEFFRGIRGEDEYDISDVVDELLVAFGMSRKEATNSR